ncbi:hypothetical protein [Paraburkholderia graminis]
MSGSLLDVKVIARLDKTGKGFTFEIQVLDDNGEDITSMFRFYARLEEADIDNKDCIEAVILKKAT